MRNRIASSIALAAAALLHAQAEAKAPPASAPAGFVAKADGGLLHRASGITFPQQIDGFTRYGAQPFDAKGHDAAISYRQMIGGSPVVARVGLVHVVAMTPQEHYLGLKGIVGTYFTDLAFSRITPAGEGPFIPPGLPQNSGYQGRFRAMRNGVPYELSLSTIGFGYWSARLTAAYPRAVAPQAQAAITALAGDLIGKAPRRMRTRRDR